MRKNFSTVKEFFKKAKNLPQSLHYYIVLLCLTTSSECAWTMAFHCDYCLIHLNFWSLSSRVSVSSWSKFFISIMLILNIVVLSLLIQAEHKDSSLAFYLGKIAFLFSILSREASQALANLDEISKVDSRSACKEIVILTKLIFYFQSQTFQLETFFVLAVSEGSKL